MVMSDGLVSLDWCCWFGFGGLVVFIGSVLFVEPADSELCFIRRRLDSLLSVGRFLSVCRRRWSSMVPRQQWSQLRAVF